jgi:hypothetical protein
VRQVKATMSAIVAVTQPDCLAVAPFGEDEQDNQDRQNIK